VINGEKVTGVTTMRMDEGLDTGDIIQTEEVTLQSDETGGSLFDRLANVGAQLCVRTLTALEDGSAVFTPQDHAAATKTTIIKKQLGQMDFTKPAAELERLIRGLNPWPSAYTHLNGKTLKVWRAEVKEEAPAGQGNLCGTVHAVTKDGIEVVCGEGMLVLREVQLEGKKRMTVDAFLRGYPVEAGTVLG
jgi:methionyl-tRNA formyltransferase